MNYGILLTLEPSVPSELQKVKEPYLHIPNEEPTRYYVPAAQPTSSEYHPAAQPAGISPKIEWKMDQDLPTSNLYKSIFYNFNLIYKSILFSVAALLKSLLEVQKK